MYGSHDMRYTGFPQVDGGQWDPQNFGRHRVNWREREGERKRERREERKKREEEGGERSSTFSLDFLEIRPSTFVGPRDKVDPRSESHVWVPKSGSFDKLQEVRNFPTWFYS